MTPVNEQVEHKKINFFSLKSSYHFTSINQKCIFLFLSPFSKFFICVWFSLDFGYAISV